VPLRPPLLPRLLPLLQSPQPLLHDLSTPGNYAQSEGCIVIGALSMSNPMPPFFFFSFLFSFRFLAIYDLVHELIHPPEYRSLLEHSPQSLHAPHDYYVLFLIVLPDSGPLAIGTLEVSPTAGCFLCDFLKDLRCFLGTSLNTPTRSHSRTTY